MEDKIKRGIVISSGGAWGAYGAGTVAALNKEYDYVAGISTGAMMSPLIGLNEHEQLKDAYTSVCDSQIFDLKWYRPKPINRKGRANFLAIIYALIFGKESLGTAYNMRKLVDKFLTEEQYLKLRDEGKTIIVGTQNLRENPSKIHYFNILDCEFNDFKDWMWASACAPFYTNLVEKEWTDENGETYMGQWTDGGVSELIALDEIYKSMKNIKGYKKEIDLIIHRPMPTNNNQTDKICNLIDNVNGVINAMRYDIEFENLIEKAKYYAAKRNTTINIYFLPRKLSSNSLIFNQREMRNWWVEGYQNVNDETKVITFEGKK